MSEKPVRVRFAPSPTGPLHMGGVRTALYNYLFAKKNQGAFIIRVEDTDQTRFVPGAQDYIMDAMKWCGIMPTEGPGIGGSFGPYVQSERKELYKPYAEQLIENEKAYYAFDTSEELEQMREKAKQMGMPNWQYNCVTRTSLRNSLTLPKDEVKLLLDQGAPYVIRMKMPRNEDIRFHDIIRGWVVVNTNNLDDKVLFKSDGMPTYHLANIVDDHLMEISHVIRGEEWLPSMPLHILLYRAFNWECPKFAHLPLILKPVGKGKLSKRDGDKLGFPVFPLEYTNEISGEVSRGYKEDGYFADAFINMLAFLGWNPGTEQEIFSINNLVESFDLKRVGKSGAKFSAEKAQWFNQQYMQSKESDELAKAYAQILKEKGITKNSAFIEKVVSCVKERATFVSDFWSLSSFFFEAPTTYDAKASKKNWKEETAALMEELILKISSIAVFSSENTEKEIKEWILTKDIGFGKVMQPLRLSLVGALKGPHLFDIIEMIGKEETVQRLKRKHSY